MTRREEIINNIGYKMTRAALEYVEKHEFADAIDAFEAGAEWMQNTMIDKACEWITEHIDIPYEGEFIDDSPVASDYVEYLSKRLEYAKAIADAFKQAMEE